MKNFLNIHFQTPKGKSILFRLGFTLLIGLTSFALNAQTDPTFPSGQTQLPAEPKDLPFYILEYSGDGASYMNDLGEMEEVQIRRQFEMLPYVAIAASSKDIAKIEQMGKTVKVEIDELSTLSLAESHAQTQALIARNNGKDGTGCAIAILDSGLNIDHCMFRGRKVAGSACFSSGGFTFPPGFFNPTINLPTTVTIACPDGTSSQVDLNGGVAANTCASIGSDFCNHGTNVAGIAAGFPCSGTIASSGAAHSSPGGVASGATLVPVNVFSQFDGELNGPLSFLSDQIAGLEWVFMNKDRYGICAVNMSLGGGFSSGFCFSSREPIIQMLRAAGIATTISTGNNGSTSGISIPSCIESAISVGALNDDGTKASFSNHLDPFVDLMAPGVIVISAVGPSNIGGVNSFLPFSGTSMAAPTVAGAFAILKAACPAATVDEIENALKETGVDVPGFSAKSIRIQEACNALFELLHPIPTMNEWGTLIFGLLLLNIGVIFIYRKQLCLASN